LKCNVRIISAGDEIAFFHFFFLTIALMNWTGNKHDEKALFKVGRKEPGWEYRAVS